MLCGLELVGKRVKRNVHDKSLTKGPDTRCNIACNCVRWGGHTVQLLREMWQK